MPVYVETTYSRAYTRVGATGLGHEHGAIGKLTGGYLQLGAAQQAGVLEFDMASFTADSQDARSYVGLSGETDADTAQQVTDNMRSPSVLDVAKYPTARYEVRSALPSKKQAPKGQTLWDLDGEFTLHGVKRKLPLEAVVEARNGYYHVVARFRILQTDYGITPYRKLLGAVGVADALDIWGDVWLTPVAPGAPGR